MRCWQVCHERYHEAMRVKGRSDGSVARDVGYSTLANAISLLCTGLLTLIVPKVFSGVQYGYWQLYIF